MKAGWASVKHAAEYADVGERKLRALIAGGEIPHVRLPSGMIRLRYADIDEWLQKYQVGGAADRLVEEILRGSK